MRLGLGKHFPVNTQTVPSRVTAALFPTLGTPTPSRNTAGATLRNRAAANKSHVAIILVRRKNLHTSCRHPGTTLSRWCLPRAGSRLGFGGKFDNLPSLKLNETSALPEAHIPGWVAADALACQTDSAHEHSRKLRFLGTGRVARCSGRQMASRSGHVLCLRGDQCSMTFFEEEVTLNTLVLVDSWKVHRISSN